MQSLLRGIIRLMLRVLVRPVLSPALPFRVQRALTVAQTRFLLPVKGVERTPTQLGGIPGELVRPAEGWRQGSAILFLHGGAYCIGSTRVARPITAMLARSSGADVYAVDYRLAPEHPHPAALDDAFAAYRALIAAGIEPGRIAIAGDSAGAGLSISLTLELADMDEPLPAALLLLCPWVDLTNSAESMRTNESREPLLRRDWLDHCAAAYAGANRKQDPRISPLFADLRGLPPILIQVGDDDTLRDDSLRLHSRAEAAGVDSTLERYPGWWHDFHLHAAELEASRAALESAGSWLARRLAS